MTIEITRPDTEAIIERHLRTGRYHGIDELLQKALGSLDAHADATETVSGEPKNLFELFAPVRGLLTDEEIDQMFTRNPSGARPVNLE